MLSQELSDFVANVMLSLPDRPSGAQILGALHLVAERAEAVSYDRGRVAGIDRAMEIINKPPVKMHHDPGAKPF